MVSSQASASVGESPVSIESLRPRGVRRAMCLRKVRMRSRISAAAWLAKLSLIYMYYTTSPERI